MEPFHPLLQAEARGALADPARYISDKWSETRLQSNIFRCGAFPSFRSRKVSNACGSIGL